MKFIVDAQLPRILSDFLIEAGFDSIHTLDFPDKNKTKDSQIIQKAIKENRIVLSKDSDFLNSFLIKSEPPKLIMVKTGNIPNGKLLSIFSDNLNEIIKMISRSRLVEINQNEIIEQA